MTTPIDPTTTRRREEAEKYANRFWDTASPFWLEARDDFLAGCEYEAPEAEKRGFMRAVEMLRSAKIIESYGTTYIGAPWADWLLHQESRVDK